MNNNLVDRKGILLVSSPRSGSTLLSNILRSHERVLFMNELFTRAPALFPSFEEKLQKGENYDEQLLKEFSDAYKYTLPFGNHVLFRDKFVLFGLNLIVKSLNKLLPKEKQDSFNNPLFKFRYINSIQERPFSPLWKTSFTKKGVDYILLKDVHIYKSLQAFKSLYPNGKIIYLIRHPYGFYTSTLKARNFPSTDEVPITKEALIKMFGKEDLINVLYDGSVTSKFMLTYRLQNEFALSYLAENFAEDSIQYVKYEDFITDKITGAHKLFDFFNLILDEQSSDFLKSLEQYKGKQQHARSVYKSSSEFWDQKILNQYGVENVNKYIDGSTVLSRFNYSLIK